MTNDDEVIRQLRLRRQALKLDLLRIDLEIAEEESRRMIEEQIICVMPPHVELHEKLWDRIREERMRRGEMLSAEDVLAIIDE